MPTVNRTSPQGSHLDFSTGAEIKGLSASTNSGNPVEHDQLITAQALKQNLITAGNVIEVDGANANLLFLQSDASVTLAGTNSYYARNSTGSAGDFDVSGYVDMGVGEIATFGSSSPYNFQVTSTSANSYHWYRRDNGDGTYMVLGFYLPGGAYTLAKVTGDPADFTNVVVEYKASPPTTGSKTVDGERYIDYDHANVTLGLGANISYAKAQNGQFTLNVAKTTGEMVTGTVTDAKVAKDYLDQEVASAKVAGNNAYDNSASSYPQAPTDVQSMGEAAKEQIDVAQNTANGAVTVNGTQNTNIAAHSTALSIANGDTDMGLFSNTSLTDNAPLKTVLEDFADAELQEHTNVVSTLGTQLGDSDIGSMNSNIYSDGGTVKAKLEEVAVAVEGIIATGTIDFPQSEYHHHYTEYATPAGWEDGVTDVAAMIIDPTGSNVQLDSLPAGTSILMITDSGSPIDGLYVTVDGGAGVFTMVRHSAADEASEFFQGRKIQNLNGASHAGATYQIQSESVTTLDTDVIKFVHVGSVAIGEGTITEPKLSPALATKVNDKCDKYAVTVTIPDTGTVTINHNLNSLDVCVAIKDSAGNYYTTAEVDELDANNITVANIVEMVDARVIVIG